MQTEELSHLENKIYKHLKAMSNTNVESGISRAFSDDDDEVKSNLLTKVEAHSKKHQATATISAYNTATVKELFHEYPAVEIQNALGSLKKKNLILQLGRGRGRAFVVFDMSTPPAEQAEPIEELAQLGAAMRPEEVAEETTQEEEVVAESAPIDEEAEEGTEEQEEEIVDDVDVLEEALDTIYKLFQRKRTEEQDRLKDMENLQHEIEQLKKQVERLQENQTDIELTTWR